MELALSLGDHRTVAKPLSFLQEEKPQQIIEKLELGFCMDVGKMSNDIGENQFDEDQKRVSSSEYPVPVQLDLLPFSPVHKTDLPSSSNKFPFQWLTENLNRSRAVEEELKTEISSPNSSSRVSSFRMDFSIFKGKRDFNEVVDEADNYKGSCSRGLSTDEEDINGISRKKLRLSKEQSAFLEESFKEHNTLNPRQKLGLAKQLNLRPRQIEVWFQNRRARTKLKQTEVDCEYLKRYCETLTEENRRLQKELQELRALNKANSSKPFSPATTLTMCPSCERVATSAPPATTGATKPKLMPKTELFV